MGEDVVGLKGGLFWKRTKAEHEPRVGGGKWKKLNLLRLKSLLLRRGEKKKAGLEKRKKKKKGCSP